MSWLVHTARGIYSTPGSRCPPPLAFWLGSTHVCFPSDNSISPDVLSRLPGVLPRAPISGRPDNRVDQHRVSGELTHEFIVYNADWMDRLFARRSDFLVLQVRLLQVERFGPECYASGVTTSRTTTLITSSPCPRQGKTWTDEALDVAQICQRMVSRRVLYDPPIPYKSKSRVFGNDVGGQDRGCQMDERHGYQSNSSVHGVMWARDVGSGRKSTGED